MNNEELKKKIVEIVLNSEITGIQIRNITGGISMANSIADALIATGIGDVKEVKFEGDHYWSMWQGALVELERAEHRSLVAERALYIACCEQNKHWCVQCDSFTECDTSNEVCIEAKKHAEELIKQAEKELAEGRK